MVPAHLIKALLTKAHIKTLTKTKTRIKAIAAVTRIRAIAAAVKRNPNTSLILR